MDAGSRLPRPVRLLTAIDELVRAVARPGPAGLLGPLAIGAGAGLGIQSFVDERFAASVLKAHATTDLRAASLAFLAGGIALALPLLSAHAIWLTRRERVASFPDGLRVAVARFAWIIALPFVGALRSNIEKGRTDLTALLAVATGVLAGVSAFHFMAPSRAASRERNGRPIVLSIVTLALAAATLFAWSAVNRHITLHSGPRLGEAVNICSNMLRGEWFECTVCPNALPRHFEPLLLLLTPLFFLRPQAETLLLLQSIALAIAAIPLYTLVVRRSEHMLAMATSFAFLAHPLTHGANTRDFHPVAFAIPCLFGMLLALEKRRLIWCGVWTLLAWSASEDVAVLTGLFGLATSLTQADPRTRRMGAGLAGLSLVYYVAVRVAVPLAPHPLASPNFGSLARAVGPGVDVGDLFAALFDERRLGLLMRTLAPMLFLPILGRGLWPVLIVAVLAFTPNPAASWTQDSLLILPLIAVFTGDVLVRIRGGILRGIDGPRLARSLSVALSVAALLLGWKFGGLAPNRYFSKDAPVSTPKPAERSTARWLSRLSNDLPGKTTVIASPRLIPHLATMPNLAGPSKRSQAARYVVHEKDDDGIRFLKRNGWIPLKTKKRHQGGIAVYRAPTPKEKKARQRRVRDKAAARRARKKRAARRRSLEKRKLEKRRNSNPREPRTKQ